MDGRDWIARALPLVLLLLGLGACASAGGSGDGGAEESTTLVVDNNVVTPSTLTVYAVPEVGTRTFVSTVTPGARATLRFDPVGTLGRYRFVAETAGGSEVVSNPVSFSPGATIRWNLSANLSTVAEPG
jgi:hypothetical protein